MAPDRSDQQIASMLIVLSGLPGVGKTAIARELARRAGAVHVHIDSIEHAIRQSAAHAALPMDDAGYLVGYAVAENNLRLGRTVVADCVNPWPQTRDAWVSVATRAGVPLIEVEVVCSDPVEHERRAVSRAPDPAGARPPTWDEIVERDYRPWHRKRTIIDTALTSTSAAVDEIMAAVPREPAQRSR